MPLKSILPYFSGPGAGPWTPFSAFPEKSRKTCKKEAKKTVGMDAFPMFFEVFHKMRKCVSTAQARVD